MRQYRIAVVPGDGIGPEVIAAGLQVLRALEEQARSFHLNVEDFPWGSDYYRAHGVMMPEDGRTARSLRRHLLRRRGRPDVPDHVTLWGLRLPICQGFDQYANVRPTRILPGVPSPLATAAPAISTG